jgi:hypothetical protein
MRGALRLVLVIRLGSFLGCFVRGLLRLGLIRQLDLDSWILRLHR